jgi:hypothetical protein
MAELSDNAMAALAYFKERAAADGSGEIWHGQLENAIGCDLSSTTRAVRDLIKAKQFTYCSYSEGRVYYCLANTLQDRIDQADGVI